ncbi:alpha/beta hydrolase family protein [Paragemmobacter ruber]|uniref:Alpha/beta fold hydrolase n=1 Tax=Paragemmobacter ruber TaxID=1985673 RepID=A0ABW9Y9E8_9RHOB|nr:alpha/beta fold hydrolase [Rhodobacter ruber]NBE08437.1 alpha/beta fold hydrolase [Rhodobacter ruber]
MRAGVAVLAVIAILLSIWRLEAGRQGLTIAPFAIPDGPPATIYLALGAGPAPVVVVAHGFAGSRPLMEPFALALAHAGYVVVSFDFMGHGRNPRPMTGDVTTINGTTRLLQDELRRVAEAALAHPRADGRLAYLGHSMASDIIIRAAEDTPPVQAVVAVSAFSQAVTRESPPNLLLISGEWEGMLRDEALRMVRLTDPGAAEGQLVGAVAEGTARQAIFAPKVEHVGVLYAPSALDAATRWLDATFARGGAQPAQARGGWILLLLAGITAVAWPLARALPAERGPPSAPLPRRIFLIVALFPAVVVPLVLAPFDIRLLPVLVADYLALHFAAYGALTLLLLARAGRLVGQFPARVWPLAGLVAVVALAGFGLALDRYVANFLPHPGRVAVIAGLALGAVPYFLGDALLTEAGRAPLWRVLVVRGAFLLSLLLAVALNFDRLMFLLIILPVILLFYLLFGTMAGWIGRRTGLAAVAGLGFGLVLAWSLGVTFPMFA